MSVRLLGLALVILACAACTERKFEQSVEVAQAVGESIADGASEVADIVEVVAEVLPPPKPARPAAMIPEPALNMLVSHEIGSPETYTKRYQSPVWPGGQSGVTFGIGYDAGHHARETILSDWYAHPHRERLAATSGVQGGYAKALIKPLADVKVPYDYARRVFDTVSIIKYYRIADRAYGRNFASAHPMVKGVLVDITYNRGGAMAGERRREMRTIRDVCLPRQDIPCVEREVLAMKRLWPMVKGLLRRCDDRAALLRRAA